MNLYNAISTNKWKTWLIMSLFIIFISAIAYVFGQATGSGSGFVVIALIFATISSFFSYFYSDKMILAISGAKEIQKQDNPELFRIVENLAIGDGVPTPKIYIMNEAAPNAFATGRDPNHAIVCVTTGILQRLNKAELEGVIAHELSHVKNYDTRLMGIVTILVGFVAILANMFMQNLWWGGFGNRDRENRDNTGAIFLIIGIILAILSPIAATLIQLAISRKREYLADASGALLTRYPAALADALEKISKNPIPMKNVNNVTAQLYIENPLKNNNAGHWFTGLFDTHPPIEERIKILRTM